ncbi:hypothetical protein [Aeoliella sp.]|uniref:hypothetical protein n=1 Tax=Aeoliella sp. TaxID=2795800 RepID=UPI003CCBED9F
MPEETNPFAAPQTADFTPPEVAWLQSSSKSLGSVKLGLTLVYTGICCLLLWLMTVPVLVSSEAFGPVEDLLNQRALLAVCGGVLVLISLVFFAGEVLCHSAPTEIKGKPLVVASIVLQGLTLVLVCAAFVVQPAEGTLFLWCLATGLVAFASLNCFVLFMYSVARFIKRPDVSGRAVRTIVFGIAAILVLYVSLAAAYTKRMNMENVSAVVGWSIFIGACATLIGLVMYANTVTYLRKAISA